MNEIVNKFLLVGDKFMPEMHLPKIKKELKSLCKLAIQIFFIKMNLIKHVFNMIWLIAKQKMSKKNSIR